MTGETGNGGKGKVNTEQFDAILFSIKKLMNTVIDLDDMKPNEYLNYGTKKSAIIYSALLPDYIAGETTINGQDTYQSGSTAKVR